MLAGITTLLVFQLAGELLARLLGLPIPGPVLGMVLLLGWLIRRGGAPASLRQAGEGLLRHLALLYVPAGVGLMLHFRLIAADWLPITVALAVSTALGLGVTAVVLQGLRRRGAHGD